MSIDNHGLGHTSKGVPGAGQFNGHNRNDAGSSVVLDLEQGTSTVKDLTAKIRALPQVNIPDLVFVNYDDHLMDDQIQAYLAGDDDTLYDSIHDWVSDQEYTQSEEFLRTFCEEHGEDYDDLDWDDQSELRQAVIDRDTSNPVRDLVRNTPKQLMRAPLIADPGELMKPDADGNWPDDIDPRYDFGHHDYDALRGPRVEALETELRRKGVEVTPEVTGLLEELVDNGPSNWHEAVSLDVIWYGDIDDAQAAPTDGVAIAKGRQLEFDGVEIVLLDRMNGSGHSVRLPGKITTVIDDDNPAVLDSPRGGGNGYGWDQVADVYKPAFEPAGFTSTWIPVPGHENVLPKPA